MELEARVSHIEGRAKNSRIRQGELSVMIVNVLTHVVMPAVVQLETAQHSLEVFLRSRDLIGKSQRTELGN